MGMDKKYPDTIPIFPLAGALLLPGGQLPLNIFEPRYLAMVEHALTTPHRIIGMIQPKDEAGTLHATGCAGRISAFSETNHGHYLITLSGISRYTVTRELAPNDQGYRQCAVSWTGFEGDDNTAFFTAPDECDSQTLLRHLKNFMDSHDIEGDWDLLCYGDPTPDLLATLAMICPFSPQEKQALLECDNAAQRTQAILAMLQMGCCETQQPRTKLAH